MAHIELPPRCLADKGVGFNQEMSQWFAAAGPIAEGQTSFAEIAVGKRLELRLKFTNPPKNRLPATNPDV